MCFWSTYICAYSYSHFVNIETNHLNTLITCAALSKAITRWGKSATLWMLLQCFVLIDLCIFFVISFLNIGVIFVVNSYYWLGCSQRLISLLASILFLNFLFGSISNLQKIFSFLSVTTRKNSECFQFVKMEAVYLAYYCYYISALIK